MKNLIKYISVISLFILLFSTTCLATGIDMNLQANEDINDNLAVQEGIQNNAGSTTISSSSSVDEGFTIGNIINIFLVVIGIVLVLLGLAILVRLKY